MGIKLEEVKSKTELIEAYHRFDYAEMKRILIEENAASCDCSLGASEMMLWVEWGIRNGILCE